jgi:hypothetical protein
MGMRVQRTGSRPPPASTVSSFREHQRSSDLSSTCPISSYPGQRYARPNFISILGPRYKAAFSAASTHHTSRHHSTTSVNQSPGVDGDGTRPGKAKEARASACGSPSMRRRVPCRNEIRLGHGASPVGVGITAVNSLAKPYPMLPCRTTLSVGYSSA